MNWKDPLIVVCSFFAASGSLVAAKQQQHLTDFDPTKESVESMRNETLKLRNERKKMKKEVKKLERIEKRLQETESALSEIAKRAGKNIEDMKKLVLENRKIMDNMTAALEAQILYNILGVVFDSDKDGDFYLDPDEENNLLTRLRAIEGGVNIDEQMFLDMISTNGRSLGSVIKVVENLLSPKVSKKKKIFFMDGDTLTRNMFYVNDLTDEQAHRHEEDEDKPLDMIEGGWGETLAEKMTAIIAFFMTPISLFVVNKNLKDPLILFVAIAAGGSTVLSAFQQQTLTELNTIEELLEAVMQERDNLLIDVQFLEEQVKCLEGTRERLWETERTLDKIANMEGKCIDNFAMVVQENRTILNNLRANVQANVLHTIFSTFLSTDKDDDFYLDPSEEDDLLMRLRALKGVKFDEQMFLKEKLVGEDLLSP
eukprot:CAMPEP_0113304676 /NCGR_PEP_ID=MMETSP0010_2-20120614/4600_1 /TAXON_ID=216773 ORGANISM="Corethron hystrix, Strain 308" /NCGR_SAMPLE_ID=MMETSP0010_2 /ASSEMBLY_ACC=CAM_ASM_000155 /LENGTH=426 /DNA_ID=CAMNT_0000158927 /DNA_START=384 /DNA_END=1668 /DNA_ORIENTATION=+ /assembly_acc=CAM_ASM_000155